MMFLVGSRWKPYSALTLACSASSRRRSRWYSTADALMARLGATKFSSSSKPPVAVRRTRTIGNEIYWSRGSESAMSLTAFFR